MKILQILVLIVSLTVFTNAQTVLLTGTVYDLNGAVIPGTKVTAKDKSGKTYSAIPSNDEGVYTIPLPAGVYTLEFIAANFHGFTVKEYRIYKAIKGKMSLDIVLNPSNEVTDEKGFF